MKLKRPSWTLSFDFLKKPIDYFATLSERFFGNKNLTLTATLEVHQAAEQNNLKKLKILLSLSHPCFDIPDEKGDTPLFYASKAGHLDIITFLLNQKVGIDHANIFGKTAIFYAAEHGHLEAIALLQKNEAKLDIIDENQQNLIHNALLSEQHAALVFLLEYDIINLNHCDKFGQTPLIMACDKQLVSSATFLISKGADINIADHDGWTALMYSAKRGNPELMATLIGSNANIHAHDLQFCQTPYLIACRHAQKNLMEMLLKNKANPLDRDYYDRSALHIAVEINNLDIVNFVLATPIDLFLKDRFGLTAHDWAVVNASAEILKTIRDHIHKANASS